MKKALFILLLLPVIAKSQIDDLNKIFNASKGFNLRTQTNAGTPSGNSRYLFWNSDSNRVVVKTGTSTFRGLLFNGEVPANTLSSTLTSAHIFVGNGSNVATDVAASGDLTLSNTGAFTLASVVSAGSCTNCNVTFDAKGRAITFSNGSGGGGTDANAWHKTGDAFGANSILGTTDNFSFDIYSNNTARGTVYNTGKFGWLDTVQLGTTGKVARMRWLRSADASLGEEMRMSTNDFIMNNPNGTTQIQSNGTLGLYVNTSGQLCSGCNNTGGYGHKVVNGLNVDDQFISLGATLQVVQTGNFTFRYSANSSTTLRRWDMTLTSNVLMWQPITANVGSEFAISDSTGANGKIMRILPNTKSFIVNFLQAPPSTYDVIVRGTTDSTFYKKSLTGLLSDLNVSSNTYTATLTNGTNVASSSFIQAFYSRNGNIVTVTMNITIDPTATGATDIGISLPIASNLAAGSDLLGLGTCSLVPAQTVTIAADTGNDRANLAYTATDTNSQSFYITFTYRIL